MQVVTYKFCVSQHEEKQRVITAKVLFCHQKKLINKIKGMNCRMSRNKYNLEIEMEILIVKQV